MSLRRGRVQPSRTALFAAAGAVAAAGCAVAPQVATGPAACPPPAAWIEPGTQRRLDHAALIRRLAGRPVVLLGESHGVAAHHRWQLSVIAALHGRRPDLVLGFEAFPRRVQPALDRWVQGELDADAFLQAVDWPAIWGHDAALYMPLFAFARRHRVPMVALNIDRALVSRVRKEGWRHVPPADRAGLGDPAPPGPAYRRRLAQAFIRHRRGSEPAPGAADRMDPDAVRGQPDFERFVEAQLIWDRAMAEAIAAARRRPGAPLVVGIMGQGHVRHREGVPHQLSALGIHDAAVLLPQTRAAACKGLPAGLADAVFVLGPDESRAHPQPERGVRPGSSAARPVSGARQPRRVGRDRHGLSLGTTVP